MHLFFLVWFLLRIWLCYKGQQQNSLKNMYFLCFCMMATSELGFSRHKKERLKCFCDTRSSFWQGSGFRYVMMVFKITRCKSWLNTPKTIKPSSSSSQPSYSSSANHTVRISVTHSWGPGLWFLFLLWQSPAVGTWASYFYLELQRALGI